MPRPQYVEPFGYYLPCGYIVYDCMGETAFVVPDAGLRFTVPPHDGGFVVPPLRAAFPLLPPDTRYTVPAPGLRFTVPARGVRFTVPARPRVFSPVADLRYTVLPRRAMYEVTIDRRYTVEPGGYRFIVSMEGGMTTGAFWNIDAPNKPWGPLDANGSVLPIPIDWERWLADISEGYGSHTLHPDPLLTVTTEKVEGGVVYVKVRFNAAPVLGNYYPLRCHILTDAAVPSEEDQTLWFKAVEK